MNDKYDNYETLQILYCSNFIFSRTFHFVYYGFNIGIVWDMIKSMQNPFDSVEVRYKTIIGIGIACCPIAFASFFIFFLIFKELSNKSGHEYVCGEYVFELMFEPIEVIFISIFIAYSIWAFIIIAGGLVRKGLNKQIKMLFLKRQITFFIIIIATQLLIFVKQFVQLYAWVQYQMEASEHVTDSIPDQMSRLAWLNGNFGDTDIQSISAFLYFSRGILLFGWMCICPLFRDRAWTYFVMSFYKVFYFWSKERRQQAEIRVLKLNDSN